MKIAAIDIETRPALVYTWSLYQPVIGIDQIVSPGGIMCFAAKWLGTRGTEFHAEWIARKTMVQRLHSLLDEADAVLHWNGESFDIPHIQREFMEAGLKPPAPFKQIDMMKTAKKKARFLSNKLDHVNDQLGLERKMKHEGFRLWTSCMDGDELARKRMRRYNMKDVTILEDTYRVLQPWIPSHPSHAALSGTRVCPRCGSGKIQERGFATLTTGRYKRLHCTECGGWSRETKRESSTDVVAL